MKLKQAVTELTRTLDIGETYLAGFLGVTEKSLNEWKKLDKGEPTPKARRLLRLHEVVEYLKAKHPEIPASSYKALVENGRIVTDPYDAEEGSVSLLNFIIEDPQSKTWVPCVEEVVREFVNSNLREKDRHREGHQSVRFA
jgi:hypothetical protein